VSRRYDAAKLRDRLVPIRFERVYRVIRRVHARTPLGAMPSPSRFSDPDADYSVLYVAEAVLCGFWEAVIRDRFDRRGVRELPRQDLESWLVAEITSHGALHLVDLRDDGPIRIGAPTAVAHDSRHAAGQSLSAAVHNLLPEADGVLFHSRFTGDRCAAVFDRALDRLQVVSIEPLMQRVEVLDALDEYDIVLTEPED